MKVKTRLTLAMTEQVSEDDYERHYDTVEVEVILPDNYKLFRTTNIRGVLERSDIIGGRWITESETKEEAENYDAPRMTM